MAVLEALATVEQTRRNLPVRSLPPVDYAPPEWAGTEPVAETGLGALVRKHWARFTSFSLIGGLIFVAGLALQAALTGGMHMHAFLSYLIQAIVSIEASFLLNRWLTWRRRGTAFWPAFLRFNAQKVLTVTANLILYAGLLRLGVNYLLANVLLTAVFTIVNYVAGDRFVFVPPEPPTGPLPAVQIPRGERALFRTIPGLRPSVSIVIPVRNNEATIRPAVESLLRQNYPELREIILIGSPQDTTWQALRGITDRRLVTFEAEAPPGVRDANFKRHLGVRATSGALVALVDSDMVLPDDWLRNAVRALINSGADCVAGVMRSIHDDYWGRFVDNCRLAAKTPRVHGSYFVTSDDFGGSSRKPPITANILFTGDMYAKCPIDSTWSHGSLEDYEWFWRVVSNGYRVLVTDQLFGWHHHRSGIKKLTGEYRRSARGCAYFIRAHSQSPFARKRLMQAITLPLAALAGLAAMTVAVLTGYGLAAAAVVAAGAVAGGIFLSAREFAATRTFQSLTYPVPALILGLSYTFSLVSHLIKAPPVTAIGNAPATADGTESPPGSGHREPRSGLAKLWHPLTAILILQAVLCLIVMRSNTAFSDEADYLELGRGLLNHWLHGTPWRSQYGVGVVSGSTYFWPPLAAMANLVGGLFGARLLAMTFMLGATALLYSAASRLFDSATACFAAALWAVAATTIQLGSFATFDGMSVSLTALSGWLIVQAGFRRHRGELVAASGIALATANLAAFSGVAIDPLVAVFAILVWIHFMGPRQAFYCTGWFVVASVGFFAGIMTVSKTWTAIMSTVFSRAVTTQAYATPLHILQDSWSYTGLLMVLAAVGAIAALSGGIGSRSAIVAALAMASVIIPLAQIHETTAVSLQKHLSYGAWFGAIAAGYGLRRLTEHVSLGRLTIACAGVLALIFPLINGWSSAWHWYHTWANSQSLVSAERSLVPQVKGEVLVSSLTDGKAEYYLSGYYLRQNLAAGKFIDGVPTVSSVSDARIGALVLFFPVTASNSDEMSKALQGSAGNPTDRKEFIAFLNSGGDDGKKLATATSALDSSAKFKLAKTGSYDSASSDMLYAIWVRK
jgi:putative flippase GtrA/GT2 family glycosyltransferase